MTNLKKWMISLVLFLSIISGSFGTVFAASDTSTNSFSISPLNPDTNQPQSTYYNLKVEPKQQKEIKVRIFNSSNKDVKVNVALNNATTNNNGVVSYSGDGKKDSSLKIPFTSIASIKESVITIPKSGSIDVPIQLRMPDQEYNGVILGGIRVTSADKSEGDSKNTPAVKANIAYSVAVLLKEKEDVIDPSMHLISVAKETRDYRNYISAELQNSAPRLIKKLEANAKVYKENSKTLLYQAEKSDMQMAPNSRFNFGISLEDTPIKAGKYTMEISGKADGKSFSFKKNFKVTSTEAKQLNKNAVYVTEDNSGQLWLYFILGAIVVVIILLSLAYIYKQKNKKESRNK